MKNNNFWKNKKLVRKGALVDILTTHSNVWPNRKQLDSICLCIPSVATITSGKKLHCPFMREWEWKGQMMSLYCHENRFELQSPWTGLGDSQGPLDHLGEPLPHAALRVLALEDTASWINCGPSGGFCSGSLEKSRVGRMLRLRGVRPSGNPNANPGQAGIGKGGSGPGPKPLSGDCGVWEGTQSISRAAAALSPGESYCAGTQAEAGFHFSREIRNQDYFFLRNHRILKFWLLIKNKEKPKWAKLNMSACPWSNFATSAYGFRLWLHVVKHMWGF